LRRILHETTQTDRHEGARADHDDDVATTTGCERKVDDELRVGQRRRVPSQAETTIDDNCALLNDDERRDEREDDRRGASPWKTPADPNGGTTAARRARTRLPTESEGYRRLPRGEWDGLQRARARPAAGLWPHCHGWPIIHICPCSASAFIAPGPVRPNLRGHDSSRPWSAAHAVQRRATNEKAAGDTFRDGTPPGNQPGTTTDEGEVYRPRRRACVL